MPALERKTGFRQSHAAESRSIYGSLQNSNRHFLPRLETAVTSSKQRPGHRSNRHFWAVPVKITALKSASGFSSRRLKPSAPAARIVPGEKSSCSKRVEVMPDIPAIQKELK